jgi:hypothetical protein
MAMTLFPRPWYHKIFWISIESMAWGDVKKIIFKSYKAAFKKYFPFLPGYGILPYEV